VKKGIVEGKSLISIQYQARIFGEESIASQISGWLEKPINRFKPGMRIHLDLVKNGRRFTFFWDNDKVKCQVDEVEAAATRAVSELPPSSPLPVRTPTPPPQAIASEPPSSAPKAYITERPLVSGAEEVTSSRPPAEAPSSLPPAAGLTIASTNHVAGLLRRVSTVMQEAGRGNFSLVFTGDSQLLMSRDYESLEASLSGLIKGQTCSIYLSQSREVIEIEGEGGKKIRRTTRAWLSPPAFSNNSVRTFGDLVENLLHFLPPRRSLQENPVITYLGKDWQDGPVLEMLTEILADHLPAERQTITLKVGREPRIVIERKDDRIVARIHPPGESALSYDLIPEPRTGQLMAVASPAGSSYAYQNLSDYHREAAALVKSALGVKEIGDIVEKRLTTGLPLETVIQAAPVRGRLLAQIVNATLKNIELPSFLERWLQVHRFIEKAYAHLDMDTLQHYRRNLSDLALYEKALKEWNSKASSPAEALTPLEELSTEEPGALLIPRWEALRDSMISPLFARERIPRESRLVLRDPQRLGQLFSRNLQEILKPLFDWIDSLERKNPPQTLSEFLNQPLQSLEAGDREVRKQFLSFFEQLPDLKKILTEGRGLFHEAFLRSALQGETRQAYLRLRETISSLETALRARYYAEALPSLEDLETPVSRRPPAP
jgi:hypothetical protein